MNSTQSDWIEEAARELQADQALWEQLLERLPEDDPMHALLSLRLASIEGTLTRKPAVIERSTTELAEVEKLRAASDGVITELTKRLRAREDFYLIVHAMLVARIRHGQESAEFLTAINEVIDAHDAIAEKLADD